MKFRFEVRITAGKQQVKTVIVIMLSTGFADLAQLFGVENLECVS